MPSRVPIQSFGANGVGFDGIEIGNIQVDGNRPALGRLANGNAAIGIGGVSKGDVVENIFVHDPRGNLVISLNPQTPIWDSGTCCH